MVDDACLSQVNSLKEPGFHLECVVHREEAQNHLWVHTDPVLLRVDGSTVHFPARAPQKFRAYRVWLLGGLQSGLDRKSSKMDGWIYSTLVKRKLPSPYP